MALNVIKLPENTWLDVYSKTGISVGTPLFLDSYQNNIDMKESSTMPSSLTEIGFPIGASRESNSTQLTAGAPGLWARPTKARVPAWLVVQIDDTSP